MAGPKEVVDRLEKGTAFAPRDESWSGVDPKGSGLGRFRSFLGDRYSGV